MSDGGPVRALQPADAGAARALLVGRLGGTRYAARALEVLDAALPGDDEEHVGLVLPAIGRSDDRALSALAVIGRVAGTLGTWRVHWVLGDSAASMSLLASAAVAAARDRGARLVACELPDDAPFTLAGDAIAAAGFALDGVVPDFVREGVSMQLWVARP